MMPRMTGRVQRYPARAAFAYYGTLILLGTIALLQPQCRAPGRPPLSFLDALFMATSAGCVTGLSVSSLENDFSFVGQAVILFMIQVGGIGIMTITTFISLQLGTRAGLRQRMIVTETLGAGEHADIRWVLKNVFALTLLFEMIGFVFLALRNLVDLPLRQALWHALFHSVSAFCNAGFSLWDSSMIHYRGDLATNGIICSLIVIGGLGYPVLLDLRANWHGEWSGRWHRLSVHTKLMLLGTLALLTLGFVGILTLEWNGVLSDLPIPERILASAFHSITCRTAGFNSIDVGALTSASLLVTILLMMVGAGPCSTAGGFKVSTLTVLVLRAWSTFRGYSRISIFRRTVPVSAVEKAVATALLFGVMLLLALTTLLIVEQRSRWVANEPMTSSVTEHGHFLETAFEVTSALGTVGLSTGLTSTLSGPGRVVIIVLMFMGRLGPISTFAALSRIEKDRRVSYPNEAPLIG
jgi:trk system potassium uptake protein